MARNFPDFLDAYLDYARDAYCPEKFHRWTGISVLAGALERRVWTRQKKIFLYPNLYVLLVARPGVGKSSATGIGVSDLLRHLSSEAGEINFLATQSSEASFIVQMARWKEFVAGGQKHTHASGFLYASEASNSLKEMIGGGVITAALTEFYDCPQEFKKELIMGGTTVRNACCNVLAGCTFDFLQRLIPQQEVGGGFASRLLYVIQDEVLIRTPGWGAEDKSSEVRSALLADLHEIYALTGQCTPSDEFTKAFVAWFPQQDAYVQTLKSERMQHFLARKHTNLLKLAMVCSVSESNSLRLELRHWDRAMELMNEVEDKLSVIVNHSVDKRTQAGLNGLILQSLAAGRDGILEKGELLAILVKNGMELTKVEHTLNTMHTSGLIRIEISGAGRFRCKLLVNAKDYL